MLAFLAITFAALPVGASRTNRWLSCCMACTRAAMMLVLPVPAYPRRMNALRGVGEVMNWLSLSNNSLCPSFGAKGNCCVILFLINCSSMS